MEKQKGASLIIVLALLTLLAMSAIVALSNADLVMTDAENRHERKLVFTRVEAGLSNAKTTIRLNPPADTVDVPVNAYPEKGDETTSKVKVTVSPSDTIINCPSGVSIKANKNCPTYIIDIQAKGKAEKILTDPSDASGSISLGPQMKVQTYYQSVE